MLGKPFFCVFGNCGCATVGPWLDWLTSEPRQQALDQLDRLLRRPLLCQHNLLGPKPLQAGRFVIFDESTNGKRQFLTALDHNRGVLAQ